MVNIPNGTNIRVQNEEVEHINEYKSLSHTLRLGRGNQINEIGRESASQGQC